MHKIFLWALDDKLVLHPRTRPGGKVLDLGTGTGIWAMQYGQHARDFLLASELITSEAIEHPDAHVIGVDLSPIQDTM